MPPHSAAQVSSPAARPHPHPNSFSTRSKPNQTHGRPPDPRPSRAGRRHPHRGSSHAVHGGHSPRQRLPPPQRARHPLRARRPNRPSRQRRHPGPSGRRPHVPRDDPPRARGPRLGAPRHVHYRQDRRGVPSALLLGPSPADVVWDGDDSCVYAQRIPRRPLTTGSAVKTLKDRPPCTYRYLLCLFSFSIHVLYSVYPSRSAPVIHSFAMYC
ncbi:hypothetical protein B0H16DRAFT_1904793, partial [Mycena metata]